MINYPGKEHRKRFASLKFLFHIDAGYTQSYTNAESSNSVISVAPLTKQTLKMCKCLSSLQVSSLATTVSKLYKNLIIELGQCNVMIYTHKYPQRKSICSTSPAVFCGDKCNSFASRFCDDFI